MPAYFSSNSTGALPLNISTYTMAKNVGDASTNHTLIMMTNSTHRTHHLCTDTNAPTQRCVCVCVIYLFHVTSVFTVEPRVAKMLCTTDISNRIERREMMMCYDGDSVCICVRESGIREMISLLLLLLLCKMLFRSLCVARKMMCVYVCSVNR